MHIQLYKCLSESFIKHVAQSKYTSAELYEFYVFLLIKFISAECGMMTLREDQ